MSSKVKAIIGLDTLFTVELFESDLDNNDVLVGKFLSFIKDNQDFLQMEVIEVLDNY